VLESQESAARAKKATRRSTSRRDLAVRDDGIRRLEVFGGVGCGKSTLVRHLARRAGAAGIRIFAAERPRLIVKDIARGQMQPLAALAALLPRKVAFALTRAYESGLDLEVLAQRHPAIGRFVSDILFDRPSSDVDPTLALKRMQWLVRDLTDLCLLEKYGRQGTYLFDEGLIMRGIGFAFGASNPEETLRRYLQHAPLPDAAIWLAADGDEMLRRIDERDGPRSSKRLRAAESALLATLTHRLISGRIPVLCLWSVNFGTIDACCDKVLDFAEKLK
jgi:hypothetical protein